MCGFVAIVGRDATAPGVIERGLDAIRHRGPDGEGVWRAPDGRAAMGHARLAILDLSPSGAQPMRSADGRAVLSYNGEVYNFREIAPRVDVPLRSRSDTEVILELLRKYGADAVSMLRGMFAFAYWDGEELLLVRDRLGIKPLYYAEDATRLIAGSEIGAVVVMRGEAPRIDGRAVDDYLTYLYVPPPRTGITGIRELPPAHRLRWKPGRSPIIERYWSVPSRTSPENGRPKRVREILADSVRAHLEADVPVGVFLSGGLDSSSLVALASQQYASTLKTFTITFGDEGRYLDERGFAREVAARFSTDHREIHVQADVAEILPEMVARFGQPFGNPTAVLTYALSQATRTHVKVALAGDGGDEVLGGYPRYQGVWVAEILRKAPPRALRSLQRALQVLAPGHSARGLPADRLRRFISGYGVPLDEMYFRWVSYLDLRRKTEVLADRATLLGTDAADEPYELFASVRKRHGDLALRDAASLIDLQSFLPFNVLSYGDRMSMAHALETRVPFCDHEVAEQLAPLPLATKMPAGLQKGLFRRAMRRDLPARVLLHRKVGFNPPIAAWLQRGLGQVVDHYLNEQAVREGGLFSPSAIRDMRDAFHAGRLDLAHPIWSIVVVSAWTEWLRHATRRPSTPLCATSGS